MHSPQRRKRGRPASSGRKDAKIVCRIHPTQKQQIEAYAQAAGLTVTQLILSAVFQQMEQAAAQ